MRSTPTPLRGRLADRLGRALEEGDAALAGLAGAEAVDERDRLLALLAIHELHLGDVDRVGPAARWQHHPALAELKGRLEAQVLADLGDGVDAVDDAVGAIRSISRRDLVPVVYDWLAEEAAWDDLVQFLALEGGPDAGFDDLVALCQVGLGGQAKLELARNYWDEMGRGSAPEVHTELHHRLRCAVGMPEPVVAEQPTSGLLRAALGGILATNRVLQPELVGALGLIELQAGPRCRKVVRALERLAAPGDAFAFYVEHATVDPLHGRAWLDHVVAPLAGSPRWAAGMVRGALWRSEVNARFFGDLEARFTSGRSRLAAG